MNKRKSRHYRVVRKTIENNNCHGMFIPHNKRQHIMCVIMGIALISFFKGIVIGLLLNNRK